MSDDVAPAAAKTYSYSFEAGSDLTWPPLVLLHGSDGTEIDLVPLADRLAPGAARLSIRGTVATEGGFAFFRRFPDRRVDEADVRNRVQALANFLTVFSDRHDLASSPIAVGFSNGAIMSTALLMTDPDLLAGAILFRPLVPFGTTRDIHLEGKPVLIVDGEDDMRRSPDDGSRLTDRLRAFGAVVSHHVLPGGHALTPTDCQIAREWLLSSGLRR